MIKHLWMYLGLSALMVMLGRPHPAQAASLYLTPGAATIATDQTITLTVAVNSGGQGINAAEATIVWPTSLLQLVSISSAKSIFTFWAIQPHGSNDDGRVTFSGGLPDPGYNGPTGTIFSMTFRGLTSGRAQITFDGAKVLASNGQGTNVLTTTSPATINLYDAPIPVELTPTPPTVPEVSSPTYLDQNAWYQAGTAVVNWTKPFGATGFSFIVTQNVHDTPPQIVSTTATSTSITLPSDGQWYFVIEANFSQGWSAPARLRLQHDQTVPNSFTAAVLRDRGPSDPSPQLQFGTTDATSGIDHYTLGIDGGLPTLSASPATLVDLLPGSHDIVVSAYDRAGNSISSLISVSQIGYPAPVITSVTSPLLLLERLTVSGSARAGDTITVYVNGQLAGQTTAGQVDPTAAAEGLSIRVPWTITSDRLWRPGNYSVTAIAKSLDGQQSVASDPQPLTISGRAFAVGGKIVAAIAVIPALGFGAALILGLIIAVMVRLGLAVRSMHARELVVIGDLTELQRKVRRQRVTVGEVDAGLAQAEADVISSRRRQPGANRTPRRRS